MAFTLWHPDAVSGSHPPHLLSGVERKLDVGAAFGPIRDLGAVNLRLRDGLPSDQNASASPLGGTDGVWCPLFYEFRAHRKSRVKLSASQKRCRIPMTLVLLPSFIAPSVP